MSSCGCDTTAKYNIDDFQEYDNFTRYSTGMLVYRSDDNSLWIAKDTNGAAGYAPTLENTIFLPISKNDCYDVNAPECNPTPFSLPTFSMPTIGMPSLPTLPEIDSKTIIIGIAAVLTIVLLIK